ncbi:histidinol dehydrogenase [Alicyclobacillus tolerans]|uniref:histidinol dehydrogenase n=1 Tax=Alicyclobacillus tolerans TaxID=90970 RepID=UPI001F0108EC|nr:histidinol dehydrogenase [Alicyclobacillus tolerans]MCF8564039.1 histidinol dehydrogenase [Alicyclobacillus tolerans]
MKLRRESYTSWDWKRTGGSNQQAIQTVQEVVADVRAQSDAAVRKYTAKFDNCQGALEADWPLAVAPERLEQAWKELPESLKEALQAAQQRIRRFHEAQRRQDVVVTGEDGERLGMTFRALTRVGVYAPGGRAAYPSTVLMNVIPAQVAGVQGIALVSPPSPGTDEPHPLVLAAAYLAGITEVYRIGGAQAIAALAYGTESIPKVDKVVGPGNLYVALAKREVMGDVGIDSIAGPSEVFIVADHSADPSYVAADMLAQAEHDPQAGAVCVTTQPELADALDAALTEQLEHLPRKEIAAAALNQWGAVVFVDNLVQAADVVNASAPEHVELLVYNPEQLLPKIRRAGAVFLGPYSPEPVGDYYAGTNHVLPTHGSARYASGLGVDDFLRRMTFVEYQRETLVRHARHIEELAQAEGLTAHARSVSIRLKDRFTDRLTGGDKA